MNALEDKRVRRFVRRSRVLRIATISPAGNPDIIPLYFVVYRGRIYMTTRSENPVVRDLLRNPAVVLLFDGAPGGQSRQVLRIHGSASFRTERRTTLPVYALAAWRYYLPPGALRNSIANRRKLAISLRYKGERGGGGVIEVIPERAEFLTFPS